MEIALIGHGRMGRRVERAARDQGIGVGLVLDGASNRNGLGLTVESLEGVDVAIDFSVPDAVLENVRRSTDAGVDMVVGTTGWYERLEEVRGLVDEAGTGLVWGPNFSIGMNLTFLLARRAAELFRRFEEFDPYLTEAHHKFKLDAPSGTAITLREILEDAYDGDEIPTTATRAGHIPGTHTVEFDAPNETVKLEHITRDREVFAVGALFAARWIHEREGTHRFQELLELE